MEIAVTSRLVAVLVLLGFGLVLSSHADSLSELSATISRDFPEVGTISPNELDGLLTSPNRPMLLDVREEKEFAVSHLTDSHRAEDDVAAQLRKLGAGAETPIVVYCSVGYRSARVARSLHKAGFREVRNLEGSIFAWANAGLPLVNACGPASGVHPYDSVWGRFLDQTKWQWEP